MQKITSLMLILFIGIILCAGCSKSNSGPEPPPAPFDGFTSIVVNKEIKSDSYLLEISSQDRHEYVEVALEHWDEIVIGDSVSFNLQYELVRINNREVEQP